MIVAVKKRRGRVIEKMKESNMIDKEYEYDEESSSEYEEMDEQEERKVKVC